MQPTSESSKTKLLHEPDRAQLLTLIQSLALELRPDRGEVRVSFSSNFDRDLGFDSLARTELLLRVEKTFSVTLPDSLISEAETPADLWRSIAAAIPHQARIEIDHHEVQPALGPVDAAPVAAETLTDALDWHVATHPERTHIWLSNSQGKAETINYSDLREGALCVAQGIAAAGLNPGARIALMLPTGGDFF